MLFLPEIEKEREYEKARVELGHEIDDLRFYLSMWYCHAMLDLWEEYYGD